MKVKCVYKHEREKAVTVGKIYEMSKNGFYDDSNYHFISFLNCNGNTLVEKWNNWTNRIKFEEVKEYMNNFTKDMLKTGMVVETRKGDLALIVGKYVMYKTTTQRLSLKNYNDDLIYDCGSINDSKGYDIVKVHEVSTSNTFEYSFNSKYMGKLLWERQEKSEAQLEIEKMKLEKAEYDKQFNDRLAELENKL